MKTFSLILTFGAFIVFTSCDRTKNTPNEQNTATSTVSNPPQFYFTTVEDTSGNPQSKIYLIYKDTQMIAEAVAPFRNIEKTEFVDKKIPNNAVSACSGFWAGLDNLFVVVDSADTWVVKAKYEDEGVDVEADFEVLKVIKK